MPGLKKQRMERWGKGFGPFQCNRTWRNSPVKVGEGILCRTTFSCNGCIIKNIYKKPYITLR